MAKNRRTQKLDQQIDENLRRVYSDTVDEPLPERFTQLLAQLREKDKARNAPPDEEGEGES